MLCVDMGHTHYNELANDGSTIYMATRSTGRIEEGPSGLSIAAIDEGCLSWRFKPLEQSWPFVLITQPADQRLVTHMNQMLASLFIARAKVIGDAPIETVEAGLNRGDWAAMEPAPDDAALWQAGFNGQGETLTVRARDGLGRTDEDVIQLAGSSWVPLRRVTNGSDSDRIGAWPEKGIFDTQLGPNRNGRK